MSNPKPLLDELVSKGKPLAEVVVLVADNSKAEQIARLLDELAPDISCSIFPAYFQTEDGPVRFEVRMDATREALEREFGWIIERINLPVWNQQTRRYDGVWADAYCWQATNSPQFYPAQLIGEIRSMGLTQPGADDDGNNDEIQYEIKR